MVNDVIFMPPNPSAKFRSRMAALVSLGKPYVASNWNVCESQSPGEVTLRSRLAKWASIVRVCRSDGVKSDPSGR
jgi:hypothetical protein